MFRWFGSVQLRDVLPDRSRIDRTGRPKGPAERPTPLCKFDTFQVAVQPSAAAGYATTRVRHD
jgi:hypothetical protein